MKQKTLKTGLVSLTADEGMRLHRDTPGDGYYGSIIVPEERAALYTEVPESEVPLYTEDEYRRKAAELIHRRYDADEEAAIQRKAIAAVFPSPLTEAASDEERQQHLTEFAVYNAFCEECKAKAREELSQLEFRV